jgi:hypothetical protein
MVVAYASAVVGGGASARASTAVASAVTPGSYHASAPPAPHTAAATLASVSDPMRASPALALGSTESTAHRARAAAQEPGAASVTRR